VGSNVCTFIRTFPLPLPPIDQPIKNSTILSAPSP
jgi:hypothetical protein